MGEYDDKFLVTCQICGEHLRVINSLHLKLHDKTVDEYREEYPHAHTSQIPCIECGGMITDSQTVNRKYCDMCKDAVRRRQDREVKRKEWRERHRNLSPDDKEILGHQHYPGLGTQDPTTWLDEIELDGVKRIKGAVWLQQEKKRLGAGTNSRGGSPKMPY